MRGLRITLALLLAAGAVIPGRAQAQTSWPNGCTVGLPEWIQQGLDTIFLGACDNHDRCWAECNTEIGPYKDLTHRRLCDLNLFATMEGACAFWAPLVNYPLGDLDNPEEFFAYCNGVAAPSIYGILSLPTFDNMYWNTQCIRGCNPDACANHLPPLPLPPTCGQGFGPGLCYVSFQLPEPEPYFPPFDPCWFVDCCGGGCSSLHMYCCGGCNVQFNWGWWDDPWYSPYSPFDPFGGWGYCGGW